MNSEHLLKQFSFIIELEKLKQVTRKTKPIGLNRYENSAEHSWQASLLALLLKEHAVTPVNIDRVIKMLLLHDIVEIETGDAIVYDEAARAAMEKEELAAAEKLFGMLPTEQKLEYLEIWKEFEARETADAKYAKAIDRLMPVLINVYDKGRGWRENKISLEQVLRINTQIGDGLGEIWNYVKDKIEVIEVFKKKN